MDEEVLLDPIPITMHSGDLDGSSRIVDVNTGQWKAIAKVKLVDADGNPVQNASVTFLWDNGLDSGSKTCTTGSTGKCRVVGKHGSEITGVTFTLTGATHTGYSYDPAANGDPDGDSDGTSIAVYRPE